MDYQSLYPWAKSNLIFETVKYASTKVLNKLRNSKPLSKSSNKEEIIVEACEDNELLRSLMLFI